MSSSATNVLASQSSINYVNDEDVSKLFPLKSISDVVRLFKVHLENAKEPDLTLLSIVTGFIENTLTGKCNGNANQLHAETSISENNNADATNKNSCADDLTDSKVKCDDSNVSTSAGLSNFPIVTLKSVNSLYDKFVKIISLIGTCKRTNGKKSNRSNAAPAYATRELIKHVSDVIWNSLIRSTYKDRAHLQSLYSYLADNKLDCFGVAFAVVAGCQQLGYDDVHLAISEDHAWVVFGKTGEETIEVTWHGKGAEDKRGQSVTSGYESNSWLYLAGHPVVCDRYIEVGAIISSINPSLNMTAACLEVAELQQQLLWLLYDMNHLQRYPMGLGCLGELEEVAPTENRTTCAELYRMAIESARCRYKNHHVYPYTYQGGYFYRQKQYKEAFASWADAGDVIRLFVYNARDDEEIYKEFMDIANELIPHIMKMESSGHSAKSILRDPHCFANLLRFYDGICFWEQGSTTPILHIGWVKPLVTTISRFDGEIRSQVIIHCAKSNDDSNGTNATLRSENNNNNNNNNNNDVSKLPSQENETTAPKVNGAENGETSNENSPVTPVTVRTTLVEALTAACGEKILNPDFLLQGGGRPFADQQIKCEQTDEKEKQLLLLAQTSPRRCDEASAESNVKSVNDMKGIDSKETADEQKSAMPYAGPIFKETADNEIIVPKRPEIILYSQKMKGLKDLLLGEKLNTHAISLQLSAQSQVQIAGKKSRSIGAINYASGTKRSRRE